MIFRREAVDEFHFNPYKLVEELPDEKQPSYYWRYAEFMSGSARLRESNLVEKKVWADLRHNLPDTSIANLFRKYELTV